MCAMTATRQRVWLAIGLLAIPAAAFVPGGTVNAPHVQTRPAVSTKPEGLKFSTPAGQQPFPQAQIPMKKGLSDGYWGLFYPRSQAGVVVEGWLEFARKELDRAEGEKWLEWNNTVWYLEELDFDIEQGTPDFVFALTSGDSAFDTSSIRALASVILSDFTKIAPASGQRGVMIRKLALKPTIEPGEEHDSLEVQIIRNICTWAEDLGRFVAIELVDWGLSGHYRDMGFERAHRSFMIHTGSDSKAAQRVDVDDLVTPEVRKLNFLIIAEPFHDNEFLGPLQDLGFIGGSPDGYPVKEKLLKLPWMQV